MFEKTNNEQLKVKGMEISNENKIKNKKYFPCDKCGSVFEEKINQAKHNKRNHVIKKKTVDPVNPVRNAQNIFTFSTVLNCTICGFIDQQ